MPGSSKAQLLPKGYGARATQPAGQAPHQPGPSLRVPEGGEQGSPEVAARFHQESRSSGKIITASDVQVWGQARSASQDQVW